MSPLLSLILLSHGLLFQTPKALKRSFYLGCLISNLEMFNKAIESVLFLSSQSLASIFDEDSRVLVLYRHKELHNTTQHSLETDLKQR